MEITHLIKLVDEISDNINILQAKLVEQEVTITKLRTENQQLKEQSRTINEKINSYLQELKLIRKYYADSQNQDR